MKQRGATNVIIIAIFSGGTSPLLRGNSEFLSSLLRPWWVYPILGYAIYNMINIGISIDNGTMKICATSYIERSAEWIKTVFKSSYILAVFVVFFGINLLI